MSFKCGNCGNQQPVGQPVNYVVTETRSRTYQNEIKHGKMRGTIEESAGSEIVKQIQACPQCYKELTGMEPRIIIPVAAVSKQKKVHAARQDNNKPWHNPHHRRQNRGSRQNGQQVQGNSKPNRPAPVVEVVNKISIIKE